MLVKLVVDADSLFGQSPGMDAHQEQRQLEQDWCAIQQPSERPAEADLRTAEEREQGCP